MSWSIKLASCARAAPLRALTRPKGLLYRPVYAGCLSASVASPQFGSQVTNQSCLVALFLHLIVLYLARSAQPNHRTQQ
ncbi:uncharacterized protein N7511_001397 [Penicillium nucicola]|uniref:uncharacterized protein n=1 Tax=Penicillium nucicola TaxID=1850975 RepID=UPI002545A9AC|nr:uncharacterized protein N7511_001397 [Penicillium nucicola]KAJ5776386.1 hypothetical protein N7511_001397 [Penicillium nucicola]